MTYCSVVTVLALVGLTKKRIGHYAMLKILFLSSPSDLTFLRSCACENVSPVKIGVQTTVGVFRHQILIYLMFIVLLLDKCLKFKSIRGGKK